MLPEFAAARQKMHDLWNRALFAGLHGSDHLLAEVPLRVQREGNSSFVGDQEIEYKVFSAQFSIPKKDAEGLSIEGFIRGALDLGRQIGKQQAQHLFEVMREPGPHSYPVTWEMGKITFDQLIGAWSNMQIDFGDDGLPRWPTLYVSPDALAELNQKNAALARRRTV
ncbi:MAG: hypothetical protein JNN17_13640 [Verrucomicrobiaceae bacterium]|nr:hypothetical protein [Verrucomicrobiaceae bacterium]